MVFWLSLELFVSHCPNVILLLLRLNSVIWDDCQLAPERDSVRVVTTAFLVCLLHALWPEVR